MAQKPSIPKGTRDFSPQEMVRRNYIFDTIKRTFQRYGYLPIETPAMENLSTLMGKYGDEGDKLIFKILNSGDFKDGVDMSLEAKQLTNKISEKALRYDLTVPFARYVVQHQHELSFPFKRYQIQPVWRADRPQKGRYREFYQCDADVIGSNSLLNEVELVQMMDDVFTAFGLGVMIKINNRKILQGLGVAIGEEARIVDITVALDKYDKIGQEIYAELKEKGFSQETIDKLKRFVDEFTALSEEEERINYLKKMFLNIPIGLKGLEEFEYLFQALKSIYLSTNAKLPNVELDLTLARGLNYYTGTIFEVKVNDARSEFTSSITGGGRYDDLTGIFGLPNMSGVGISFGADRIYDVLLELNLFPESVTASTKLLFVTFGETEQAYCLPLLANARKAGINSEVYPDASAKMKKQMGYADDKKVPFVVIIGGDEMQSGLLTLKNMTSGEQEKLTIDQIIERLK
jgi:histidyl-tRNA synthetase